MRNTLTTSLPAQRFECVSCGTTTAEFPARGGSTEQVVSADVCGPCRATIGIPAPAPGSPS